MKGRGDEDTVLIRKCKAGDKDAWQRLIDAHKDGAYRLAFRLTRNYDDAEDIVIDSFVRVHRGLNSFAGSSTFSTWLYRIVTNCFLDSRRFRSRNSHLSLDSPLSEDGVPLDQQFASKGPSPMDLAMVSSQHRELIRAIDDLAPNFKALIVLFHTQMLSYEEIDEVMDTPIGTVKSRLFRARQQLRDSLDSKRMLFATA